MSQSRLLPSLIPRCWGVARRVPGTHCVRMRVISGKGEYCNDVLYGRWTSVLHVDRRSRAPAPGYEATVGSHSLQLVTRESENRLTSQYLLVTKPSYGTLPNRRLPLWFQMYRRSAYTLQSIGKGSVENQSFSLGSRLVCVPIVYLGVPSTVHVVTSSHTEVTEKYTKFRN